MWTNMRLQWCLFFISAFPMCICHPTLFLRSGDCASPPVEKDFDIFRMNGQWYEISRFPSEWEFGRCIQVWYNASKDGAETTMRWEQILENGSINYAESVASIKDSAQSSKLSLRFMKPFIPWETPFWIVATDYKTYAVMYSCYEYHHRGLQKNFNTEFAWIMSRRRTIDSRLKWRLKSSLALHKIYTNMFIDNEQTRCDAYDNESSFYFHYS